VSLCENHIEFPPKPIETASLSESNIREILKGVAIMWMAERYEGDLLFGAIAARYFSANEPASKGNWLRDPGVGE